MKARTEHGKFVAAARALIVHGWSGAYAGLCDPDRTLRLRWHDRWVTLEHLHPSGLQGGEVLCARVSSIQQAVDHLVVADVLPAEHASWTGHVEEELLLDYHRYRWYRLPTGEYLEKLTGAVYTRERLESTRGPLTAVSA